MLTYEYEVDILATFSCWHGVHGVQGAGDAPAAAAALGEGDAGAELVNADAERALLRVRHKLEGVDSGAPPHTSRK